MTLIADWHPGSFAAREATPGVDAIGPEPNTFDYTNFPDRDPVISEIIHEIFHGRE